MTTPNRQLLGEEMELLRQMATYFRTTPSARQLAAERHHLPATDPRTYAALDAAALRLCRQTLGLTQAQVSKLIGVTVNTLARWERGEAKPRIRNIDAVSRLAGPMLPYFPKSMRTRLVGALRYSLRGDHGPLRQLVTEAHSEAPELMSALRDGIPVIIREDPARPPAQATAEEQTHNPSIEQLLRNAAKMGLTLEQLIELFDNTGL